MSPAAAPWNREMRAAWVSGRMFEMQVERIHEAVVRHPERRARVELGGYVARGETPPRIALSALKESRRGKAVTRMYELWRDREEDASYTLEDARLDAIREVGL